MKKYLCMLSLSFFALSSQATDYKIQICRVPLTQIINLPQELKQVASLLEGFHHIYIKNHLDEQLHFEPENRMQVLGWQARIGEQRYSNIHGEECFNVLETTEESIYDNKWGRVKTFFELGIRTLKYHALADLENRLDPDAKNNIIIGLALRMVPGADHANCQMICEGALKEANLSNTLPVDTNIITSQIANNAMQKVCSIQ